MLGQGRRATGAGGSEEGGGGMERWIRRERRHLTVEGRRSAANTVTKGDRAKVERGIWPRNCGGDSVTGGRARWRGQGNLKSNNERGLAGSLWLLDEGGMAAT
ncbi:NADH dehydrogenase [Sesbania bispinosa]|nr:NADH dehydrogenase [Sesbania bispinosa]